METYPWDYSGSREAEVCFLDVYRLLDVIITKETFTDLANAKRRDKKKKIDKQTDKKWLTYKKIT